MEEETPGGERMIVEHFNFRRYNESELISYLVGKGQSKEDLGGHSKQYLVEICWSYCAQCGEQFSAADIRFLGHKPMCKECYSKKEESLVCRQYLDDNNRVEYIIRRLEGEGKKVAKSNIMSATGWLNADCQAILDAMLVTGQIRMYTETKGTKKITYYTLVKRENEEGKSVE